jgi:superfamily II DNA helicase RecQ
MPKFQPLVHIKHDAVTAIDPIADALIMRVFNLQGTRLKDWQAQALACLVKGQDLFVKAGTGAGKTLVFWSMIEAKKDGIVLVLSPLKSIISTHVIKLCAVELTYNRSNN